MSPVVEVKLFGALNRFNAGKSDIVLRGERLEEILDFLTLGREEVGLVLVNRKPVESAWDSRRDLSDGDTIEIYPIVGGG